MSKEQTFSVQDKMMEGFDKAMKYLADNATNFDQSFEHAFATNANIDKIVGLSVDKDQVREKMKIITRMFFDAGSLSALAIKQAEADDAELNAKIKDLPEDVQKLIKSMASVMDVKVIRV